MIKAIETRYKGYRFRSRLEARWAVFFDALELAWEYEPEGFEMGSGRYLPDFRVRYVHDEIGTTYEVWFEVKPDLRQITQDEWPRMLEFQRSNGLIVLDGVPDLRLYLSPGLICDPDGANAYTKGPYAPHPKSLEQNRFGALLYSELGQVSWKWEGADQRSIRNRKYNNAINESRGVRFESIYGLI